MPTKTKAKSRTWTPEQKQAARDAYNLRIEKKKAMALMPKADTQPAVEFKPEIVAEGYELEVWNRVGDRKDYINVHGAPCRWKHFHSNEDEWVYHEALNFYADSGYQGSIIEDRIKGMVGHAFLNDRPKERIERFGELDKTGDQTYSKLPAFDQQNRIEVIVRIRKGL